MAAPLTSPPTADPTERTAPMSTLTDAAAPVDLPSTLDLATDVVPVVSDTPGADTLPTGKPPRGPRIRRPREGADKTPKPAPRRGKAPKIGEGIAGLYVMAGMGLAMVPSGPAKEGTPDAVPGMPFTMVIGMSIATNAEACGAAWEKLADENPQVKAALERILTVSVFSQLIAAHLPILLVAGAATGMLPPQLVSLLTPPAPAAKA